MSRVEVRSWEGEARVAGHRVEVAAEGRGLRLPQAGNVRLRPLTFGERSRLARVIADGENSAEAMAGAVSRLAAADAELSEDLRVVIEILSLHLAGACSGAPGFAEEVGLLGRWMGWSPAQIDVADAADIDEIARTYGLAQKGEPVHPEPGDGWVSLRLDRPTFEKSGAEPESDLEALRSELASDILRRVRALPDLDVVRGAPPRPASPPEPLRSLRSDTAFDSTAAFREADAGEAAAGGATSTPRLDSRPSERGGDRAWTSEAPQPASSVIAGSARVHDGGRELQGGEIPENDQPQFTILKRADAPVGAPAAEQPRSAAASWTPSAEWIGPRDSLTADRLAAIYPAIFGGGAQPSRSDAPTIQQQTPEAARSGGNPTVRGERRTRADFDPFAGAKAMAVESIARAPVTAAASAASVAASAAAALGFDVDDVAKALNRAADLRGVAP